MSEKTVKKYLSGKEILELVRKTGILPAKFWGLSDKQQILRQPSSQPSEKASEQPSKQSRA